MDSPVERLSEDRRALLERELARRRALRAAPAAFPRRPAGAAPALSMAQRRLWFLDRIAPGRSTYNATMTMRLTGALDLAALHFALDEVVRRHEALRTVGVDVEGQPQARLLEAGVAWTYADLVGTDEPLEPLLTSDARRPFDLAADVLLRAFVYRTAGAEAGVESEHVLMLVLHHIASDGWSRGILFAELTAAYNARVAGQPSPLTDLGLQYSDYAAWQDQRIASGSLDADLEFWREQVSGTDLVLDLPTDLPRPNAPSNTGGRVELNGPPESADAMRALARTESATFFMGLMAASGMFLHALTGQQDYLLGSPVANRQHPELEPLIGFFVNTVVFRVQLHDDPSLRTVIQRCRQATVACLAHQEMPFDRLVETLNPKRRSDRNPLFQVNYRMQGVAPPTPQLTDVRSERLFVDTGSARFDLAIGFIDGPGALRGYLEYNDALFLRPTVEAWVEAFLDLIERVTDDPDQPLSKVIVETRARIERARAAARAAQAAPSRRGIRSGRGG